MKCFTMLPVGLLCALLFLESGLCRPQDINEEQNDADEPNDEEQNDVRPAGPAPVILTQAKTIIQNEGETVTLPCDVKDLGEVLLSWSNGTQMLYLGSFSYVASQPRISRAGNSLVIGNVTPADSGVYTCKLLISQEQKPSISHTLQVKLPAAIVSIQPSGKQEIQKGNTLSLKCEVTGFPTPHVKWVHRHRKDSEHSIEHEGHELTITNVSRTQSGIYECVAENELNVSKASVEVTVLFEPEIEIQKDIVNTAENVYSELICIVHGHPTPKVKWFKEMPGKDLEIKNGPHHNVTNKDNEHTLRIERTNQSDFGVYYCHAENSLGDVKRKIKVFGNPLAPTVMSVSNDSHWSKITWQIVSSSPILEYNLTYWKTLGSNTPVVLHPPVQNAISANVYQLEYVIKNLERTSYEAVLSARNAYGWSDPSNKKIFVGDQSVPTVSPPNGAVQTTISLMLVLVTLVASLRC